MRALVVAALLITSVALADAGGASSYQSSMRTTPFNAQAATGTATSSADKIAQFDTVLLGVTYAAITGAPATCTIQIQNSVDDSNYFSWGPSISIAPGASPQLLAISSHPTPVGSSMKYVYACGTYPTAGTLTLKVVYSAPDNSVNRAYSSNGTTVQSGLLMIGGNDGTNARQLAVTTGGFPKMDLEQIAGLAVVTVAGVGELKVGITGNAGTSLETTAGVLDFNIKNIGNSAASTAATGVLKVGAVGNAGAAVDAAHNAAAPANVWVDGFEAQSSALSASATAGNVRRGVVGLDGVFYTRQGGPLLFSGGVTAIGATLTQIVAAPAAGTSLYLTDVFVMSDTATAGSFLLRYGTGTNCATGTTTLWPNVASLTAGKVVYPANTAFQPPMTFTTPLKVPAANALCIICVATNTCTATVHGYPAP